SPGRRGSDCATSSEGRAADSSRQSPASLVRPLGRARDLSRRRLAGLMVSGRVADFVLLVLTAVELGFLFVLVPRFTATDWIYVAQHLLVLGIALTRHPPKAQDRSPASTVAVVVSYAYPYAQVALVRWVRGYMVCPTVGLVLVTVAAGLSLASLLTLGRGFGLRPALRRLATTGPYRLVRHPIYLA